MAEPVTLAETKVHLRVDHDDDDALITGQIVAAREWVESYTGLILVQREIVQEIGLIGRVELNAWPIAPDADVSIAYSDSAGAVQTITNARLAATSRPARLSAAWGTTWPYVYGDPAVLTITAGYAAPGDVPASLKAAILLTVGDLYALRESGIVGVTFASTGATENLCRPYRQPVLG